MPRNYEPSTAFAPLNFGEGQCYISKPSELSALQPCVHDFYTKDPFSFSPLNVKEPPHTVEQKSASQIPFVYNQNNISNVPPINIPSFLIPKRQKRQKFTPDEDKIILNMVGDNQFPNWSEIASHIKGKTGRQCRERFQHYLSPKISRDPWTPQEDQLIIKLYEQYGPNWAQIAQHFNGKRTNNNIKNRYNNHIKLYKNSGMKKKNKKIALSPIPHIIPPQPSNPSQTVFPLPQIISPQISPENLTFSNEEIPPDSISTNEETTDFDSDNQYFTFFENQRFDDDIFTFNQNDGSEDFSSFCIN